MPGSAVFAARGLATDLATDLRALRVAGPEARFFDGRFFEGRVVRRERDFAAMIPLTLADPHHATAARGESRRRGFFPFAIGSLRRRARN
jgi:hypothetical protein